MLRGTLDLQNTVSSDLFMSAARQWSRQFIGLQEISRGVRRLGSLLCSLSILFPFEQRVDFIAANRRQTYRTLYLLRRSLAR
jgi:hypothetical protein